MPPSLGRQPRLSLFVASHAAALLSVAAPLIALHSGVRPFARRFFCTDESIAYPYKKDMVPFPLAVGVGIGVAIATILIVEAICLLAGQPAPRGPLTELLERRLSERTVGYLTGILKALYAAKFGVLCTELVTQAGKLGFGRHRPHFLSVCRLLNASAACRSGLPLNPLDVCGAAFDAPKLLGNALVSFPSGHSSFSVFVGAFLALYLQARLSFSHPMHPVKNACQLALLVLAGFVCVTRISDYHHHWSDVLAGALIGAIFAFLISLKLAADSAGGLSIYRPQRLVALGSAGGAAYELVNSDPEADSGKQ